MTWLKRDSRQVWDEYKVRHERPGASHGAHQRADRRMTPSLLLILNESRMGTSGWQHSLNHSPPEQFSWLLSATLTLPLLPNTHKHFLSPSLSASVILSFISSTHDFLPLGHSWLRSSSHYGLVSIWWAQIVLLSWHPWNLVRSHSRCLGQCWEPHWSKSTHYVCVLSTSLILWDA